MLRRPAQRIWHEYFSIRMHEFHVRSLISFTDEAKQEERIEFIEFTGKSGDEDPYPGLLGILEPDFVFPKKFCGVEIDPEV